MGFAATEASDAAAAVGDDVGDVKKEEEEEEEDAAVESAKEEVCERVEEVVESKGILVEELCVGSRVAMWDRDEVSELEVIILVVV